MFCLFHYYYCFCCYCCFGYHYNHHHYILFFFFFFFFLLLLLLSFLFCFFTNRNVFTVLMGAQWNLKPLFWFPICLRCFLPLYSSILFKKIEYHKICLIWEANAFFDFRDAEDHISWLLQHGWHEKALAAVEAGQGRSELLDEVFFLFHFHFYVFFGHYVPTMCLCVWGFFGVGWGDGEDVLLCEIIYAFIKTFTWDACVCVCGCR